MKHFRDNPVLRRLAPYFIVVALIFYGLLFAYWRSGSTRSFVVPWYLWMIGLIIIIGIPLLFIFNEWVEGVAASNPSEARDLGNFRRGIGGLLVIIPFILVHLTDVDRQFGTAYTRFTDSSTGSYNTPYSGLFSISHVEMGLFGLIFFLGVFTFSLGKGRLRSEDGATKALLSLILAIPLTYALFLFNFANHYSW